MAAEAAASPEKILADMGSVCREHGCTARQAGAAAARASGRGELGRWARRVGIKYSTAYSHYTRAKLKLGALRP